MVTRIAEPRGPGSYPEQQGSQSQQTLRRGSVCGTALRLGIPRATYGPETVRHLAPIRVASGYPPRDPQTSVKQQPTYGTQRRRQQQQQQQQKQQQQQPHRRMRLDGLQSYGTEYCWSLDKSGTPCEKKAQKKCPVPYCAKHLRVGDDAFSTREHPLGIGKILIANFDLPKNYKMVYFGTRKPVRKLNKLRKDYMLSFWKGGGVIDPQDCPVSSKLQYMSNPGPAERSNVTCTDRMFGDTRDEGIVGREYKTTEFIPKGTQMLQFYGPQWFASRDMEKINVGTNKYPAPLKRKRI